MRQAPLQHHRAHGLRHRAAEVLQHPGLPLCHPALRGCRHPRAVQRRGPGASQATSGVEAEQPNAAPLAANGPAPANLAQDLRGGRLRGRGQGLSTEAKVRPSRLSLTLPHISQSKYFKNLKKVKMPNLNRQICLRVQPGKRVQRLGHGLQGRRK